MFPLQVLGPPLADHLAAWVQAPAVGTPAIGIKPTNPKWFKQRLEFHQYLIRTATKGIGHHLAGSMIERCPQPPRVFLAADKVLQPKQQSSSSSSDAVSEIVRRDGGSREEDVVQHVINESED